jgi:hypothetical protein
VNFAFAQGRVGTAVVSRSQSLQRTTSRISRQSRTMVAQASMRTASSTSRFRRLVLPQWAQAQTGNIEV